MVSIDEILGPHQIVYDVYFSQVDSTGSGIIGAFEANNFLKQSKLKDDALKEIWDLSDPNGRGYLDRHAFYTCLKLVSLAQSGQPAKLENLSLASPAPKLGELSSNITSLVSPDDPWYIKASSRISYDRTFDSLSPINNKITGARVKPFLLSTNLPVDILGKIWELSDLDQDGQLDRDEFLIALQLVNKAKEGTQIPDQLPPSLLPFKIRHSSISSVPLVGGGLTNPVFPAIVNEIKPWIITFEEKSKSDIIFNQTDTDMDGFVTGAECKDVFLKTGLSSTILANIWALCDTGSTGRLNCEQFALAMHFINKKLATGLDPPPELLPEMIPPSLRPKPIVTEEAHASKEFEELQCQVTELQREKLFYEQRAAENEMQTRVRRTELTQLELEMESIFKTVQEREMKKSEEQKKLSDCEERLGKVNAQLVDLRAKFDVEKSDVDKLRMQIQNVDMALRNKDTELGKMKTLLQAANNEHTGLDARLTTRKQQLAELINDLDSCNLELALAKNRNGHLKALQNNLTQLIKLYGDSKPKEGDALLEEIKALEAENERLLDELNKAQQHQQQSFNNNTTSFANSFSDTTGVNSSSMSILPDPFQAVDPFSFASADADPFRSANSKTNASANDDSAAFDPFGTAATTSAFDPFADSKSNGHFHDFDSPIPDIKKNGKRKEGPVRPAPPRPQTPNASNKKPDDQSKAFQSQPRPQSAFPQMDFFSSDTNEPGLNSFDPFGQQAWTSVDTSKQAKTTSAANFANFSEFDPFA